MCLSYNNWTKLQKRKHKQNYYLAKHTRLSPSFSLLLSTGVHLVTHRVNYLATPPTCTHTHTHTPAHFRLTGSAHGTIQVLMISFDVGPWETGWWGSHLHLTKTEDSEETGSFLVCFKVYRSFTTRRYTHTPTANNAIVKRHNAQVSKHIGSFERTTGTQLKSCAVCDACAYTQDGHTTDRLVDQ